MVQNSLFRRLFESRQIVEPISSDHTAKQPFLNGCRQRACSSPDDLSVRRSGTPESGGVEPNWPGSVKVAQQPGDNLKVPIVVS